MPDYGFNLNLGPQTKPMTIADMLGIAQAAQQFQQTQQMNPLLLRQQQLNTQKMEALNPEEIQTGIVKQQEERKREPIATSEKQFNLKKNQTALGMQLMGGLATDPRIQNAARDPKGAIDVLIQGGQLLQAAGLDENTAKQLFAPLIAVAQHEPDKLPQVMKNIISAGTSAESQAGRATPQLTATGGAPALFTSGTGELTQPKIQGQPQSAGEPAFPEPSQPTAQPKQGGLPYPVRKAGDIRPYAPGEAEDQKAQQQHRQVLLERQRNLTSAERIADEVIKTAEQLEKEAYFAKGGIAGNLERKMRMWIESETYDRLAKDLANQALANAKVLGTSDTVGGLNLAEAATGSVKVPPEVIIEIARRNKADQVNIDLQAKAKNEFAKKYGDSNGAAFDQMWRDNSDSLLFEAIAIDKSKMPADKKKEAFKKLFKDLSPENIAKIKQQKQNIDRMVNGEFPGIQ